MMAPGGVYIQNKSFYNCNSDIEYTYFVSYLDDLLDVTVSSCLVLAFRVVPFLFVSRLYVNNTPLSYQSTDAKSLNITITL
jgi:hypothetical protein